jgi:hypothetical protein
MKISIMGVALSQEEIEAIPDHEPDLEAHFMEPIVSAEALDAASKVVPERIWIDRGLHSWLTNRAKEAFKLIRATERSVEMGRLRYIFEYPDNRPVLKTVYLIPPEV